MTIAAVEADSPLVDSQSQFSPILCIPCEITSEIFQNCLPESPEHDFPRPSIKCAPLQLSHVCCAWRELVVQTPHLWSKVLLSSTHVFEETSGPVFSADMAAHAEALQTWMRRASPLRLSVHLQYPTLPRFLGTLSGLHRIPPAFRVIVENATRWKAVRLSLPEGYLSLALFITQEHVCKLESLDINNTSIPISGPKDSIHMPTNVFVTTDTAETLSTLSVCAGFGYISRNRGSLERLRTVSLKCSTPGSCLHLLEHCPVLEDLTLSFYDLPDIRLFSNNPVTLPRLRNFRLSHTGNDEDGRSFLPLARGGDIGLCLDKLQLPNLQEFYLWMTIVESARDEDPNLPWDYLSRLIERSNCSLSRLELRSPHLDNPSILESLRLSPELKYLGIPADEELERSVAHLLPGLEMLRVLE